MDLNNSHSASRQQPTRSNYRKRKDRSIPDNDYSDATSLAVHSHSPSSMRRSILVRPSRQYNNTYQPRQNGSVLASSTSSILSEESDAMRSSDNYSSRKRRKTTVIDLVDSDNEDAVIADANQASSMGPFVPQHYSSTTTYIPDDSVDLSVPADAVENTCDHHQHRCNDDLSIHMNKQQYEDKLRDLQHTVHEQQQQLTECEAEIAILKSDVCATQTAKLKTQEEMLQMEKQIDRLHQKAAEQKDLVRKYRFWEMTTDQLVSNVNSVRELNNMLVEVRGVEQNISEAVERMALNYRSCVIDLRREMAHQDELTERYLNLLCPDITTNGFDCSLCAKRFPMAWKATLHPLAPTNNQVSPSAFGNGDVYSPSATTTDKQPSWPFDCQCSDSEAEKRICLFCVDRQYAPDEAPSSANGYMNLSSTERADGVQWCDVKYVTRQCPWCKSLRRRHTVNSHSSSDAVLAAAVPHAISAPGTASYVDDQSTGESNHPAVDDFSHDSDQNYYGDNPDHFVV